MRGSRLAVSGVVVALCIACGEQSETPPPQGDGSSPPPAAARWRPVGIMGLDTSFVDLRSVTESSGVRAAWVRVAPDSVPDGGHREPLRYEFHCGQRTARVHLPAAWRTADLLTAGPWTPWEAPPPESYGERLLDTVCALPMAGAPR